MSLSKIVVPSTSRNEGVGTAIMKRLVVWADKGGLTITLTPEGDFGGSVPRLKRFYKKFGFVLNKGRNKDYEISDSMYRLPKALTRITRSSEVTDLIEGISNYLNKPELSEESVEDLDSPPVMEIEIARIVALVSAATQYASKLEADMLKASDQGVQVPDDWFKEVGRLYMTLSRFEENIAKKSRKLKGLNNPVVLAKSYAKRILKGVKKMH